MRPYRTCLLLAGLVFGSGQPVRADGWSIGGFLGGAATHPNTLTLRQQQVGTRVSLAPVRYDSQSLESPIYYGYRVAWFARRNFGLEGEFIHPKVFARTAETVHASGTIAGHSVDGAVAMRSVVERFSISHGLNFLMVNAVFRPRLDSSSTPRFWLVARGGAGITIPHVESAIGGSDQQQYQLGSLGIQAGIGAELRLSEHVFATVDYKLTTTNQSVSVAMGTMHGRFTAQHVAVGLAWRTRTRP
jgi:opacity protein-like surface antigen